MNASGKNVLIIGEDYKNTDHDYIDLLKKPALFENYNIWAENCNKYPYDERLYNAGVHSNKILNAGLPPAKIQYIDCIRYHPLMVAYINITRILLHSCYALEQMRVGHYDGYSASTDPATHAYDFEKINEADAIKSAITRLLKNNNNIAKYEADYYDSILSFIPRFFLCLADGQNMSASNLSLMNKSLEDFKVLYDHIQSDTQSDNIKIDELITDIHALINDVHSVCKNKSISIQSVCDVNSESYGLYIFMIDLFMHQTFKKWKSGTLIDIKSSLKKLSVNYPTEYPSKYPTRSQLDKLEPHMFVDLRAFANVGISGDMQNNIIVLCGSSHIVEMQNMLALHGFTMSDKSLHVATSIPKAHLVDHLYKAALQPSIANAAMPIIVSGGGTYITPTWIALILILVFIILLIGYLVSSRNKCKIIQETYADNNC